MRKQIIEEVNKDIRDQVTALFSSTARELIAEKLNLKPPKDTEKDTEKEEEREKEREKEFYTEAEDETLKVKTALAEEILFLSRNDALEKLKLSLATGKIDESTYQELKSLVRPAKNVCPQCGKPLEPTANFCRFCGSKIT